MGYGVSRGAGRKGLGVGCINDIFFFMGVGVCDVLCGEVRGGR